MRPIVPAVLIAADFRPCSAIVFHGRQSFGIAAVAGRCESGCCAEESDEESEEGGAHGGSVVSMGQTLLVDAASIISR